MIRAGSQPGEIPIGKLDASPARTLEVCVASVDDASAAAAGGADRLELNVALELGGITPSLALVKLVIETTSLPIIVMNRPRAAGFCYAATERLQMLRDAELIFEQGAAGMAAGVLRADRTIDDDFWRELVKVAGDREVVFHRAFDLLADRRAGLDQLADLGTTRILTSGGSATAVEGAAEIARLVAYAGHRIEILAGSGITPENIGRLWQQTGCHQLHGSFSHEKSDPAGPVAAARYPGTSQARVAAARQALDRA